MLKVKNVKKVKQKVISRFCKKHVHIIRLWLKHLYSFSVDGIKTVGGGGGLHSQGTYYIYTFIVLKQEEYSKLKM